MSTTELLTPQTVIVRNESQFLASPIGDEIVMMNIDNGDYIGINAVGGDIWNLLAQPMTVGELVAKIIALYEVSEGQATEEINAFLHRMLEQQFILIQGE